MVLINDAISNIDSIKDFLKYDDKPISRAWVNSAGILNMVFCILSLYFKYKSEKNYILEVTILLFILCVTIYYNMHFQNKKKYIYLFYGIFMCFFSVTCGLLSFQLFKTVGIDVTLFHVLIYCILVIIGFILTCKIYEIKIKRGSFSKQQGPVKVLLFPIAGSILIFRCLDGIYHFNYYITFGVLFSLLGLILSSSTYFFVKSYCYYLIEQLEEKSQNNKK